MRILSLIDTENAMSIPSSSPSSEGSPTLLQKLKSVSFEDDNIDDHRNTDINVNMTMTMTMTMNMNRNVGAEVKTDRP